MSEENKNTAALHFPELAEDIQSILERNLENERELFVTRSELESLRGRRDREQKELSDSIQKVDDRIDEVYSMLESFQKDVDKTLQSIKVDISDLRIATDDGRKKSDSDIKDLREQHKEEKSRVSSEMDTIRNNVENTADRISQIQLLAANAVDTAHKTQISLVSIEKSLLDKIDPVYSYLFGDDTREPLMYYIQQANDQVKAAITSNHQELSMLVNRNTDSIEATNRSVQPTIASVDRLNRNIKWFRDSISSTSGKALLVGIAAIFLSGTPIGDAILSLLRISLLGG